MALIPIPDEKNGEPKSIIAKVDKGLPFSKAGLTDKQKNLLKEKIKRFGKDELIFYIVPTADFINVIAKGTHPIASQMSKKVQKAFLEGNGLIVDTDMILDWIYNRLDYRNSFTLDNCEIRLGGVDFNLSVPGAKDKK